MKKVMVYYTLAEDPNQTFEVSPYGITYVFTLKRIRGFMYVTIEDSLGNRISGPLRVCNAAWLIPHTAYNNEGGGNFLILNQNNEYPDFKNFETSCQLRYYTAEEIESLVA